MDTQELKYRLYLLRRPLAMLALLLALVALAYVFTSPRAPQHPSAVPEKPLAESIRLGTAAVPEYTPEMQAKVAKSAGFQALVSYTDNGFEPQHLAIRAGDTVRFTNNSSAQLWVAASGGKLYPAAGKECGSSALDSCVPLAPQDFWEFTFDASGEWEIVNNLQKEKSAVVKVEVK